jgi:precorrin-6Y C5,15-methyltransferase (decarboxylating)
VPEPRHPVALVGSVGGEVFGAAARDAVSGADVLVGSPRHLAWFDPSSRRAKDGPPSRRANDGPPGRPVNDVPRREDVELVGPLTGVVEAIRRRQAEGRRVCVLTSGDPGFFGLARILVAELGREALRIFPAPSSVALAWAAAGLSWDDAEVVSAHGRPLADAVAGVLRAPKVAVLTAPANPPEALGKELLALGSGLRRVVVASRLGEHDEQVVETDLDGLAAGQFDPLSVVLVIAPDRVAGGPSISWGRSEDQFAHRNGMITKGEVRSIVLGSLLLPRTGVLWDVGAGSGSVGVEAATVAPGLRVFAVEQHDEDAARVTANAAALGVSANVEVVVGRAPAALAGLPHPDRVFVGGGGLDVVRGSWERLSPGGRLVATFVVLDRAVAAFHLLGEMVQVHVDRCVPVRDVGVRLEPTNPVFVCSGTR